MTSTVEQKTAEPGRAAGPAQPSVGQELRQHHRAVRHHAGGQRGRGHLRARRQRRGQVHPHQDHRRAAPAEHGHLRGRGHPGAASPRRARRWSRGIATVYQDLAVVPLMPVWRNFFLGNEVRKGPRMDIRVHEEDLQGRAARHGHRPARRRPADRHAVRRRAPVRGDLPRRVLRRQGADPGRADGRARRQAVRRGAEVHRPGPGARPGGHLHHPQPAPRLPGR